MFDREKEYTIPQIFDILQEMEKQYKFFKCPSINSLPRLLMMRYYGKNAISKKSVPGRQGQIALYAGWVLADIYNK